MLSLRKRIVGAMTAIFGFLLGSSSILLGLPVAKANSDEPDKSHFPARGLKLETLPPELRSEFQNRIEALCQSLTVDQRADAIFGIDENGNLEIIGSKKELQHLKERVEELDGRQDIRPTSG